MSLYEAVKNSADRKKTFDEHLTYIARQNRYLLRTLLELSPVCNFSCPFCYARKTPVELSEEGKSILRFPFWKGILDQLSEMGVMYIGLTGGECMLHPDFLKIFEDAVQKGFVVYLISNGSCLTDDILETCKKTPPIGVNITVYGGSEETYQKICGRGEYYNIVKNNLQRLSDANIPFSIQMTVSRDNVKDVPKVFELGRHFNVRFGCACTIISCERCTRDVRAINSVSDDEYRNVMRTLHRLDNAGGAVAQLGVPKKSNIKGITCSAGRSSAFINHEGKMMLCVSYQETRISTFEHSVKECWQEIVKAADRIPQIDECNGCIHATHCIHCFGAHYYDTGKLGTPSPELCFKKKHPEEAAEIEAYYEKNGSLPPADF